MKRAILTLLLLTLAASVAGTPGEAVTQKGGGYHGAELHGESNTLPAVPRGASHRPMTLVCAVPSVCQSNRQGNGVGVRSSGLASMPAPSGAVGTVVYSASATWCAPTPTRCQGWGGNARLAAVNSFRFGDEPYWVRVWREAAFADALVVSHCACFGQDRYIDVSPAVFRQLAPLKLGRIDVEVEVLNWPYEPGGDPPPHPDDDRLRVEDGGPQPTVPPTDTVK